MAKYNLPLIMSVSGIDYLIDSDIKDLVMVDIGGDYSFDFNNIFQVLTDGEEVSISIANKPFYNEKMDTAHRLLTSMSVGLGHSSKPWTRHARIKNSINHIFNYTMDILSESNMVIFYYDIEVITRLRMENKLI